MIPVLSELAELMGTEIDLPQWEFKNLKTTINKDIASIQCVVEVTIGDEKEVYEAFFELEFIEDKWLISNIY